MNQTVLEPKVAEATPGGSGTSSRWMVLIFNNDTNSLDEVIDILMKATKCGVDEAVIETWECHTYGKAPVHFAPRHECEDVAHTISCIGVKTEVRPEWED